MANSQQYYKVKYVAREVTVIMISKCCQVFFISSEVTFVEGFMEMQDKLIYRASNVFFYNMYVIGILYTYTTNTYFHVSSNLPCIKTLIPIP